MRLHILVLGGIAAATLLAPLAEAETITRRYTGWGTFETTCYMRNNVGVEQPGTWCIHLPSFATKVAIRLKDDGGQVVAGWIGFGTGTNALLKGEPFCDSVEKTVPTGASRLNIAILPPGHAKSECFEESGNAVATMGTIFATID